MYRKTFSFQTDINHTMYCIPKSFNINIKYQFFNYKIPFVNLLHAHTNLKGYFEPKVVFRATLIITCAVYQKSLIPTSNTSFSFIKYRLWIHTHIQKVILYSETGFNCSFFKDFLYTKKIWVQILYVYILYVRLFISKDKNDNLQVCQKENNTLNLFKLLSSYKISKQISLFYNKGFVINLFSQFCKYF